MLLAVFVTLNPDVELTGLFVEYFQLMVENKRVLLIYVLLLKKINLISS